MGLVAGFVVGFVVLVLVILVAGFAIAREHARMQVEPPDAVFDFDEAVEWVVQHVPDDVAAELTLDDVHRIIDLQLEYFRRKGVSRNGRTGHPSGSVIVGGSETVDYVLARAAEGGTEYSPRQVRAVLQTQLTYLRAVGAVGPPARPGEAGEETTL